MDELGTYVFDINPKQLRKVCATSGRIWVMIRTFRSLRPWNFHGLKKKKRTALTRFETFRENIRALLVSPTPGQMTLFQSGPDVRFRVWYTNHKAFGATVRLGPRTSGSGETGNR